MLQDKCPVNSRQEENLNLEKKKETRKLEPDKILSVNKKKLRKTKKESREKENQQSLLRKKLCPNEHVRKEKHWMNVSENFTRLSLFDQYMYVQSVIRHGLSTQLLNCQIPLYLAT